MSAKATNDRISTREYLERINAERFLRQEEAIKHERELRESENRAAKLALELQAAEYERRLEILNGEHGRAKEALVLTVPREMYHVFEKSTDARLKRVELWAYSIPLTLILSIAAAIVTALRP